MKEIPRLNTEAGSALPPAVRRRSWKYPSWLVTDPSDQGADIWDRPNEPEIKRYPIRVRALIIVGIGAGLWCLIIMAVFAFMGGAK